MTNPTNRVGTTGQNQKIVFVTQRPQTPNTVHQIVSPATSQTNTVVKFGSAANTVHTAQKTMNTTQKILVVSMPTSSHTNTPPTPTQGSQPPISVVPKPIFSQQGIKSELQAPPDIDDLSHLA